MLISAIHMAGLVALRHTPSPMGFLSQILGRPAPEKPFLILVVGYPDGEARVPDISKNLPKKPRLSSEKPCSWQDGSTSRIEDDFAIRRRGVANEGGSQRAAALGVRDGA